jgi:hypothetical protein
MTLPREIQLVSKVRPPRSIHKFVLQLAEYIGAGKTPVWVPVRPAKGAIPHECFFNVPEYVKRHGGEVQYGWTVWQCANLFIEGEFHSVWKSPNGELVDPTPKTDGENRILFIPDGRHVWNEVRVDNRRLALLDRPEIHDFIKLCMEETDFVNEYMKSKKIEPGQQYEAPPGYHERFEMGKGQLSLKMAGYIRPTNATCPCDSGRHFCNCCGKL